MLVIDTRSLVRIHESEITLAPINTGAVLYDPAARGSDTLLPISGYPYDTWRSKRGSAKAIAEVAVDYAVPDIGNHILSVERRRFGYEPEVVVGS